MKEKYLYYSNLFNFINKWFFDPWDMSTDERHNERKVFISALFSKKYEYIKPYIDYLQDFIIEDIEPVKTDIIKVNKLVSILTSICNE